GGAVGVDDQDLAGRQAVRDVELADDAVQIGAVAAAAGRDQLEEIGEHDLREAVVDLAGSHLQIAAAAEASHDLPDRLALALHVHIHVALPAAQPRRLAEGLQQRPCLDAAAGELEGDGRLRRGAVDGAGDPEPAAGYAGVELADRELAAGEVDI